MSRVITDIIVITIINMSTIINNYLTNRRWGPVLKIHQNYILLNAIGMNSLSGVNFSLLSALPPGSILVKSHQLSKHQLLLYKILYIIPARWCCWGNTKEMMHVKSWVESKGTGDAVCYYYCCHHHFMTNWVIKVTSSKHNAKFPIIGKVFLKKEESSVIEAMTQ